MNGQKILALSGANERLLVAVENEGLHYRVYRKGFQHNEQIFTLCWELLAEAGLKLQDVTAFAIDLGPGSFTGQRISLSFTKGLSFALGKPLLGFDTFELWRHSLRCCCGVLVLIDGRKRRFYARLFGNGYESTDSLIPTWDLSSRDLCGEILGKYGAEFLAGLCITGPGASVFWEELTCLDGVPDLQIWQSLEPCLPPNEAALAVSMLELAQHKYQARHFMKASDGPLYLRKSDAEERFVQV